MNQMKVVWQAQPDTEGSRAMGLNRLERHAAIYIYFDIAGLG